MATEPAKKEPAANVQPIKPRKKGKLLWIVIALVAVGAGAGAWFAFKPAAQSDGAAASSKPVAPHASPIYYKFDPAFVVNFGGEGSARYLQVTVEAMSRDMTAMENLKSFEPAVRNDLVMLFSGQDNATLMTVDGKEKLRAATLASIRKVLDGEGGNGQAVEAVYFTSFVIQ
ncbi:MAG TPA: flagellar basal body-associated FliL family protein [Steroidobacteraceae bacterium]|jgi:flagellar FliL protein|nr:flagellar basal body-associated FliL family protein [Steroidobacteraceae bacterium]